MSHYSNVAQEHTLQENTLCQSARIRVLFQNLHQIYIKLKGFENNDSEKLPFKYY